MGTNHIVSKRITTWKTFFANLIAILLRLVTTLLINIIITMFLQDSWVSSQSNEPKNTVGDYQNSIKTLILLDIFLWCHFNVVLIMECLAK